MALQIHHESAPRKGSRQNSLLQVPNLASHDAASSFEGFLVLQFTELQERVASRAREFDGEVQLLRTMLARALEAAGPEVAATIKGTYAQKDLSAKGDRKAARDLPDYNVQLPTDPCMPTSDSSARPCRPSSSFAPQHSRESASAKGLSSPWQQTASLSSPWQQTASLPEKNIAGKTLRPEDPVVAAPPPRPLEVPQPPSLPPSKLEPLESGWTQDAVPILPGGTADAGDSQSKACDLLSLSAGDDPQNAGGREGDSVDSSARDSPPKPMNGLSLKIDQGGKNSGFGRATLRTRPTLGALEVPKLQDGTESNDSETWDNTTGQRAKVGIMAEATTICRHDSQDTQSGLFDDEKETEETFAVLPLWEKRKTIGLTRGMTQAGALNCNEEDLFAGDHDKNDTPRLRRSKKGGETREFDDIRKPLSQHFIIEPHSPVRFSWDILGLVLITGDAAVIPLQFFNPPRVLVLIVIEWISRVFWSIDMPLSCITGFISQDGAIEMTLQKIAMRYFTSWFCLDVVVVTFDWLDVIVGSTSGAGMGAARAVKAVKFIRMLRLMRLMRLMKMPTMLNFVMGEVAQHFRSEKLFFIGKIGKVLFLIIGFVHVVGCFWYAIGEAKTNGWVEFYGFSRADLAYRYMTSFHWSLANFAGAMDVEPTWVGERGFAVCVLLSAWMISATALSFITTAMTRDSFSKIQQSMQTVRLRRYLQEHCVNRKLQERLMKNAKYAINQKSKNMNEEDVELLQLVSVPLLIELHFEVNSPVLRKHPFFDNYADLFPAAIRRICHTAVSQHSFSKGDVLFTEGEKPSNPMMYFTLQGELKYMQGPIRPKWLHAGMWACEPVLWSEWVHAGYLCSMSECTLLGLSTTKFYSIARNFEFDKVEEYASLFVKELNNAGRQALSDLPNAALNPEELADHVFHGVEIIEEHWARPCRESKLSSGSGKPQFLLNGQSPRTFGSSGPRGFGSSVGDYVSRTLSMSSRGSDASARMSELLNRISSRVSGWAGNGNSVRHVQ